MKNGIIIILACFFALAGCGRSDKTTHRQPSPLSTAITQDLSNQRITAFAEDSAGYIWMGTFRGLNRYNGHDFHQFFCTDDTIDLPDNQINHLFRDSRNRLWVGTISGSVIYDNAGHFRRVGDEEDSKVRNTQFLESRDKVVHARLNNRLARYDEKAKRFVTVIPNINPTNSYYLECTFDRRNRLWIMDATSLRSYNADYRLVDSVALPGPMNAFYIDNENDRIWMGGNRQLAIYDLRNRRFETVPPELSANELVRTANISQIHPYDNYWLINTINRGLLAFNVATGKVTSEHETGFPFELPNFRINRFFTDSRKNLWAGSYDHGFAVVNRYERQFNSDKALQTFINGLSVGSVDADINGNIWATSNLDGVSVYNRQTGEASHIDARQLSGIDAPIASVSMVRADSHGNVWLASLIENKVWRCKWQGGKLVILKEYPVLMPHVMYECKHGELWIGGAGKWVARYDTERDTFDHIEMTVADDPGAFVSGIAEGADKMYAIVFDCPLVEIADSAGVVTMRLAPVQGWDECIKRSVFIPTDVLFDSYGLLWIGTVGNGLLCYDPQTTQVRNIEGMPCCDISSIEEDRQGHIWVSTQYGLARIDRTTGDVKCYYASDGIGGNQFYDRASTVMPDGTMVFGGTHGLTVFNPIDVGIKRRVPLVFDDFKMHNVVIDPHSSPEILSYDLSHGADITLERDQNGFSISFAALDYAATEMPHYYYMLEGHDNYWIDARQNNEAYYSNLNPGKYCFRVKIGDDNNSLMEQEISVDITIKGSPWQSWWAYCLYVLVAALLIGYIYFHRRRVRQQREKMAEVMQMINRSAPVPDTASEAVENDANASEENSYDVDVEQSQTVSKQETEHAPDLTPQQAAFMQELQSLMESELSNSEVDINRLTEMMHISRTKLYYKVKEITGVNPSIFFKTYKLNRAAQLLKEGRYSVAEIADMAGFSTPAHFSTSFKKQFGKTPTEYAK